MKSLWLLFLLVGASILCQAGEMYKYKDANGHWVFSDKPPEKEQHFETLTYTKAKKPTRRIKLYYVKNSEGYTLHAKNNFYIPIELGFISPLTQKQVRKLLPARGSIALFHSENKTEKVNYHWALGDPNSVTDNSPYHAPFYSPKAHTISQAFNGKFSHTN